MPDPSSIPIAFISHAKTDAKQAADIAAALERNGVKCWIAPRDVEPGRNFGDEIIRGIEASRAFILVLSTRATAQTSWPKSLPPPSARRRRS